MAGGTLEKGCVLCYAMAPEIVGVSLIFVIIKYFLLIHQLTGSVEGSRDAYRPRCRVPRPAKAAGPQRPPWPRNEAGLLNSDRIVLEN